MYSSGTLFSLFVLGLPILKQNIRKKGTLILKEVSGAPGLAYRSLVGNGGMGLSNSPCITPSFHFLFG